MLSWTDLGTKLQNKGTFEDKSANNQEVQVI